MCQGCDDFLTFERVVDAILAKELPEAMDRVLAVDIFKGAQVDA